MNFLYLNFRIPPPVLFYNLRKYSGIPVEFAQIIFFVKNLFLNMRRWQKMAQRWGSDSKKMVQRPSFAISVPSFAISAPLKTGFKKKILLCANSTGITDYLRNFLFWTLPLMTLLAYFNKKLKQTWHELGSPDAATLPPNTDAAFLPSLFLADCME